MREAYRQFDGAQMFRPLEKKVLNTSRTFLHKGGIVKPSKSTPKTVTGNREDNRHTFYKESVQTGCTRSPVEIYNMREYIHMYIQ